MVLQIATRTGFQRFRGEIIKAPGGGINKVVSALFFKGLSFIFLFFFFADSLAKSGKEEWLSSFADTELSAPEAATDTPDTNSKTRMRILRTI